MTLTASTDGVARQARRYSAGCSYLGLPLLIFGFLWYRLSKGRRGGPPAGRARRGQVQGQGLRRGAAETTSPTSPATRAPRPRSPRWLTF